MGIFLAGCLSIVSAATVARAAEGSGAILAEVVVMSERIERLSEEAATGVRVFGESDPNVFALKHSGSRT